MFYVRFTELILNDEPKDLNELTLTISISECKLFALSEKYALQRHRYFN